jgi:hypothetical protein
LSLTLFALGGADLTTSLGTLGFGRPTTIVGLVLDIVAISHAIMVGTMHEELERCVNMGLLRLLLCLARARCFASSVVTLRGYKSELSPSRTPTSSRTTSHCLLASFPMPKMRERERGRMKGVDVSYAAPQAHKIVNVALHREYSLGIIFIFFQERKYLYYV